MNKNGEWIPIFQFWGYIPIGGKILTMPQWWCRSAQPNEWQLPAQFRRAFRRRRWFFFLLFLLLLFCYVCSCDFDWLSFFVILFCVSFLFACLSFLSGFPRPWPLYLTSLLFIGLPSDGYWYVACLTIWICTDVGFLFNVYASLLICFHVYIDIKHCFSSCNWIFPFSLWAQLFKRLVMCFDCETAFNMDVQAWSIDIQQWDIVCLLSSQTKNPCLKTWNSYSLWAYKSEWLGVIYVSEWIIL